MSEVPYLESPGVVRRPAEPASEVAGPPLTELVYQLRRAADGLHSLYARAKQESQVRYYTGRAQGQTDGNGDVAIWLQEVPQGATGYLTICAIDMAGVTPAAPVTSANLWHAIYAGGGINLTAAQITVVGAMLDCSPDSPVADGQLPFVYRYGDWRCSPTLVGPQSFYVVIDAATAARQIGVRFGMLIEQPEP